jgi:hypothetical protein
MARITRRTYDKMVKVSAAMKTKPGQIIGYRVSDEPADKSEHFCTCKKCGQAVDKRDLGQVFHHELPNHQPLPESPFRPRRHNASEVGARKSMVWPTADDSVGGVSTLARLLPINPPAAIP